MKKLLFLCVCVLASLSASAQLGGGNASVSNASVSRIDFRVQSDGSFKTVNGQPFVVIECPGLTQQQLYYAFLVTIQHKCVSSGVQYTTVDNRCINVYSYESYFSNFSVWNGGFVGYLYYKFMFQFKDGLVRIEDPIVDHLGNGAKNTMYMKFGEMLHGANPLFDSKGQVVAKRAQLVDQLNKDLNSVLNEVLLSALSIARW